LGGGGHWGEPGRVKNIQLVHGEYGEQLVTMLPAGGWGKMGHSSNCFYRKKLGGGSEKKRILAKAAGKKKKRKGERVRVK